MRVAGSGRARGKTYELKSNATGFLATDGNVEEAAATLCIVSVSMFPSLSAILEQ
jgi:hypothetical protein